MIINSKLFKINQKIPVKRVDREIKNPDTKYFYDFFNLITSYKNYPVIFNINNGFQVYIKPKDNFKSLADFDINLTDESKEKISNYDMMQKKKFYFNNINPYIILHDFIEKISKTSTFSKLNDKYLSDAYIQLNDRIVIPLMIQNNNLFFVNVYDENNLEYLGFTIITISDYYNILED